METSTTRTRWWELAARAAELDLPANMAHFPSWMWADGETRRVLVGPDVRAAVIGTGWTARVLLDGLGSRLAWSGPALRALLDPSMEGPLWLDVGRGRAALEGAAVGGSERALTWAREVMPHLGGAETLPLASRLEALPTAELAGIVLPLDGEADPSILLQVGAVEPGLAPGLARAGGGEDLLPWLSALGPARALQVVLPLRRAGLSLRGWYMPHAAAADLLRAAGASEEALARLERLLAHARREEVAFAQVDLPPKGPASIQLAIDLGLALL